MEIFLHKQHLVTWGFARSRSPTLKVCSNLVRFVNYLSCKFRFNNLTFNKNILDCLLRRCKIRLELQLYAVIVLLLRPITKINCDIIMKVFS